MSKRLIPDDAVADLAAELEQAELTRVPSRQLTQRFPEMTLSDSYAVQKAWIDLKRSKGRRIIGHKIGLTSRAMQMAVGINEPDFGVLMDDMLFSSGVSFDITKFIQPRIEVEIGFVMKERVAGPDVTPADILKATDHILPTIELLDARVERIDRENGATRTVRDTIADNAANSAIITGGPTHAPDAFDMRWISALCYRNGVIEETGVAAGVLNDPALSMAWLANRIAQYGVSLEPGQIVLSGSFIRPVDVRGGNTFHADFGSFGAVTCHFNTGENTNA